MHIRLCIHNVYTRCLATHGKGGWCGWKPSSSSDISIRALRAQIVQFEFLEFILSLKFDEQFPVEQFEASRAIRSSSISVSSTLPPSLKAAVQTQITLFRAAETMLVETMSADLRARAAWICWCKCTGGNTVIRVVALSCGAYVDSQLIMRGPLARGAPKKTFEIRFELTQWTAAAPPLRPPQARQCRAADSPSLKFNSYQ